MGTVVVCMMSFSTAVYIAVTTVHNINMQSEHLFAHLLTSVGPICIFLSIVCKLGVLGFFFQKSCYFGAPNIWH